MSLLNMHSSFDFFCVFPVSYKLLNSGNFLSVEITTAAMRHLTSRLCINSMVADLFLEINNQLHVRSGQFNLTKMAASDSICAASLL